MQNNFADVISKVGRILQYKLLLLSRFSRDILPKNKSCWAKYN